MWLAFGVPHGAIIKCHLCHLTLITPFYLLCVGARLPALPPGSRSRPPAAPRGT